MVGHQVASSIGCKAAVIPVMYPLLFQDPCSAWFVIMVKMMRITTTDNKMHLMFCICKIRRTMDSHTSCQLVACNRGSYPDLKQIKLHLSTCMQGMHAKASAAVMCLLLSGFNAYMFTVVLSYASKLATL